MKKALRILAVAVLGVGLSTGMVSAAAVDTTGPNSTVTVESSHEDTQTTTNNNNFTLANNNTQTAASGEATADDNTYADDATTGDAENTSSFSAEVTIENSSANNHSYAAPEHSHSDNSIRNTGPNSTVNVTDTRTRTTTQTNTNNVSVVNTNTQSTISGDAYVTGNTNGGDATTGDAINHSTSSVIFHISN